MAGGSGAPNRMQVNELSTNGSDDDGGHGSTSPSCGSDVIADEQSWSPSKSEYVNGCFHSSIEGYINRQ